MSTQLWRSFLEDDIDLFHHLLHSSSSGHAAQQADGPAGAASVATGSPGRALIAGSPNIKAKSRAAARSGGGKGKHAQDVQLTRADVNSKDAHGITLLHLAASLTTASSYAYARALLSNSLVDLYVQDYESGWTALHRALYSGNVAVARELMVRDIRDFTTSGGSTHAGGLIKIKDREGNSPFDVYARTIAPRLIPHAGAEALLPAGSDDEDDEEDLTPGDDAAFVQDAASWPSLNGDELYMFGSNKNLTLGFSDQDDRQFPERISLKRPEVLLQRFSNEHTDAFPRGPFALAEKGKEIPAYVRFKAMKIQDVQLSKLHSAVLTADPQANLYICGFGSGGRLGTGDQGTRFGFTSVLGGGLQTRRVVAIGLGQDHSLAVTLEGELYSWGSNKYGQLGYAVTALDQNDEEAIQLTPRQIFGPLKREAVIGCAASRVHSVVFTSTSLFTFGKNDGQLGLVDSDARLLDIQITPRRVAASLFSSSIVMVTAIDKATTCLLENHDVWIFSNFGYRKVPFPLSSPVPFIRDSFSAVDRRHGPNKIIKICSGGDTVSALARFGEVFHITVSQKMDATSENVSSTTHPNKIRGALSAAQLVWSPRKDHMAAIDVDVGQDGSVILCTQSGSVWRKVKRAKIKEVNPLQEHSESTAKDYKFSRVPGLTEICGVRSNAFGAFAAIRKETNVLQEQIRISPSKLWEEVFPLLSFSGLRPNLVVPDQSRTDVSFEVKTSSGASEPKSEERGPGAVRRAILMSGDIETDLARYFERQGPSRSSDYDMKVGSTVSDIRIPCHQFLLIGRSAPLMRALSSFSTTYYVDIPDVLTVEYDKDGIMSVIFLGLDILSVLNVVFYLYTDNIIPVWNMARKAAEFGPRYRQVRIEVMKAAGQLDLRGLEKAARLMSEPTKDMHRSLDTSLHSEQFLSSGDIEIQLEDTTVRLHSAFVCRRCPFFEGLFHGRASGGWLASRKKDMDEDEDLIAVDLEHVDMAAFQFVVRYLYGDVDEELFSDCTHNGRDDFLDTVLDVLSVANELMIDRLAQICQKVIGKYTSTRNLCWLLNAVNPCSVTEFKNAALESICLNLEGMMENRYLDELDEDILEELGEAVRNNQLAYLPISKSDGNEARLLEEYPDLVERIERDKKVKIDYMRLRSHAFEDEAKLARLERITMQRAASSSGDMMFDMDEDKTEHGLRNSPKSPTLRGLTRQAEASASSPIPNAQSYETSKMVGLSIGSSAGAFTPPSPDDLNQAAASGDMSQAQDSSSPWTTSSFKSSKLDMREIMAQASESKRSNISAALAAAGSSPTLPKSTHFGKMSQKERKRQIQAQKESASKHSISASTTPTDSVQGSAWQIQSTKPVSLREEIATSGNSPSSEKRRPSGSPSLTMRQTIPGNLPSGRKTSVPAASPENSRPPMQRRTVSSPAAKDTTTKASASSSGQRPPTAPTPVDHSKPSKSSPIIPKSIRHIPPTPTFEPTEHSSMADILAQQQVEKSALRAAASKRSLQEIQEEQAFQEWWDQEEAATKARLEYEAAVAAATETKSKETRGARGRGRARAGVNASSGRGRGRRGSAAADERPAVEADRDSHGRSRGDGNLGRGGGDRGARSGRRGSRGPRRGSEKKGGPTTAAAQ